MATSGDLSAVEVAIAKVTRYTLASVFDIRYLSPSQTVVADESNRLNGTTSWSLTQAC
jgi:hypothetical protein